MLSAAAREAAGVTALVVNSDSPVGLTLAIEQPETLGADILAADAAAAEEYPLPVIVFDFGTATTRHRWSTEQRRYRRGRDSVGHQARHAGALHRDGASCRISESKRRRM